MFYFAQNNSSNDSFGALPKAKKARKVVRKQTVSSDAAAANDARNAALAAADAATAQARAVRSAASLSAIYTRNGVSSNLSVPQGSKVKFVATFINYQNQAIAALNPISTVYELNKRREISGSKQTVKQAFEKSFDSVNVVSSLGGGALEVNFKVNQDWDSGNSLRSGCVSLIQSATGYNIETAFLVVTERQGRKTNEEINNSPSESNDEKIKEAKNFLETLAETLGVSVPVTMAIFGLGAILILKK